MSHDLNDTLAFVRVLDHGSFTAAARAMGIPKTTVSRKVQELEARLGTQLMHRTTRRLGLTEAGKVYYDHCRNIARDLEQAENAVGQLQGGPRGWLRVAASFEVGIEWIAPLLGDLQHRHPEMRTELVVDAFNSEPIDLVEQQIDVAVRAGSLPDSSLSARRLATLQTHIYASQRYMDRHGEPAHPGELHEHRALVMATRYRQARAHAWPLHRGAEHGEFRVEPAFVANDPAALRVAMLAGEGLMLAGDVMVNSYAEAGTLRRVLPEWRGPDFELNAVFPRGQVLSPKVRAFVDFLVERLGEGRNQ